MSVVTETVVFSSPFDSVRSPWRRFRYGRAATLEVDQKGSAPIDDKYSVISSSAASPDLFGSPGFFKTLDRVRALNKEDSAEDRPSVFASQSVVSALTEAARFIQTKADFPKASASVGVGQGLRLTWRLPRGEVRLIADGEKASKSYLYIEPESAESYIERTISGDKLAAVILDLLS